MKSRPSTYYVTVIEDVATGKIIAAATLIVELKFARQCALVSFIRQNNILKLKHVCR